MCEIAVKKDDNSSDIPENARWMAGDIVAVCPEGHPWTDKERERFHIVKLPGISVEEGLSYCLPIEEPKVDSKGVEIPGPGIVTKRSRFKLDTDKRCFTCKITEEDTVLEDIVVNAGGNPELMDVEFRKLDVNPGKDTPGKGKK